MSNASTPAVLVVAKATSADAMEELECAFDCVHLWQQRPATQHTVDEAGPFRRRAFADAGCHGIGFGPMMNQMTNQEKR